MRRAFLILMLLGSTAATAQESTLPVPPIPPAAPPPMDAPMPNFGAPVPSDGSIKSPVTFDTAINHRPAPASGYGYLPGARYQLDNDRKMFVPGFQLHLPLP